MKRYTSVILSAAASVGVIATAIFSAKVTPDALEAIKNDSRQNHNGDSYAYTKKEAVKSAWKFYIPAVVIGGSTIACIVGSNALDQMQQASMASAYALLSNSYNQYKKKVKDICGEEIHNKVLNEIAKESTKEVHPYVQGLLGNTTLEFDDSLEERHLFYDMFSNRYFESTVSNVLQAEYHINRNYALGASISVNDFYEFLGLEPIKNHWDIGWYGENMDGLYWIDFNHQITKTDDGLEIYTIAFDISPTISDPGD